MVDEHDDFDSAAEDWLRTVAAGAFDALKADPSRAISAVDVRARFEGKWTNTAVKAALGQLDGTDASAVAMLAGLSAEEIDVLGGVPE